MFGQGNAGQNSFKSFGLPTITTTATSTSATGGATSGFTFGLKPSESQQQIPATSTALKFSGFGVSTTGNINIPKMTSTLTFGLTNTATTSTTQANITANSLSFAGQSSVPITGNAVSSSVNQTIAPSAGFSVGQMALAQSKSSTIQGTTSTTAPKSLLSNSTTASTQFETITAKSTIPSQANSQAIGLSKGDGLKFPSTSTSALSITSGKTLTYKELEDIINKWIHELEEQEKVFLNQAKQVNTWDRLLIQNGGKITILNSEMERLKTEQNSLNRELDFILSKQQELEETLSPLEEQIKDQQTVPYMQHADIEREKTYQMADNIDSQLKRMMQDLKDIINHINTSNANLKESEDPMVQIAKILNSHMDSLQWIDQSSVLLQKRVEDVSRYVENQRREHERSYRLTFD